MATVLDQSPRNLQRLAAELAQGALVAMPTETVYGLAGDARSDAVVARIYEVKQRPRANPLIAHYPELAAMERDVEVGALARKLARRFWPGPLTLVLWRRAGTRLCERASAGLATQAVRCPAHAAAAALLRACGFPLVAPSANPSGRLSPVSAAHVQRLLGDRIPWILDGGPARRGLESTIVDLTGDVPELLREGAIARESLAPLLGRLAAPDEACGRTPAAPGMAFRHYAPGCPLILGVPGSPRAGDALLAFGPEAPGGFDLVENLSERGDLEEAAGRLFSALHALEAAGSRRIFAMRVPEIGVGRAINDRLRRAAAASEVPP